jgi:hypothetical protein
VNVGRWRQSFALAMSQVHPVVVLVVLAWTAWGMLAFVFAPHIALDLMQHRSEVARLKHALAKPLPKASVQVSVQEEALLHFRENLGDGRHLEQQVRSLLALAQAADVELREAKYKYQCDALVEVCRYSIDLPVQGHYPAVKWFILKAMAAMPYAVIDEIDVKRDGVNDDQLHARLKWSLHVAPTSVDLAALKGRP